MFVENGGIEAMGWVVHPIMSSGFIISIEVGYYIEFLFQWFWWSLSNLNHLNHAKVSIHTVFLFLWSNTSLKLHEKCDFW